jgi:hypothetical protein
MIVKPPVRSDGPPGRALKVAKGYGKAIMLEWASFSAGRTRLNAAGFGGPDFLRSAAVAFLGF